jgi:hypothetical protein
VTEELFDVDVGSIEGLVV